MKIEMKTVSTKNVKTFDNKCMDLLQAEWRFHGSPLNLNDALTQVFVRQVVEEEEYKIGESVEINNGEIGKIIETYPLTLVVSHKDGTETFTDKCNVKKVENDVIQNS